MLHYIGIFNINSVEKTIEIKNILSNIIYNFYKIIFSNNNNKNKSCVILIFKNKEDVNTNLHKLKEKQNVLENQLKEIDGIEDSKKGLIIKEIKKEIKINNKRKNNDNEQTIDYNKKKKLKTNKKYGIYDGELNKIDQKHNPNNITKIVIFLTDPKVKIFSQKVSKVLKDNGFENEIRSIHHTDFLKEVDKAKLQEGIQFTIQITLRKAQNGVISIANHKHPSGKKVFQNDITIQDAIQWIRNALRRNLKVSNNNIYNNDDDNAINHCNKNFNEEEEENYSELSLSSSKLSFHIQKNNNVNNNQKEENIQQPLLLLQQLIEDIERNG